MNERLESTRAPSLRCAVLYPVKRMGTALYNASKGNSNCRNANLTGRGHAYVLVDERFLWDARDCHFQPRTGCGIPTTLTAALNDTSRRCSASRIIHVVASYVELPTRQTSQWQRCDRSSFDSDVHVCVCRSNVPIEEEKFSARLWNSSKLGKSYLSTTDAWLG